MRHRPAATEVQISAAARPALLAAFVAAPLAMGLWSSLSTLAAVQTWYQEIAKPAWTPPDWIFGPVWTALYLVMGIAGYLAWTRGPIGAQRIGALILFGTQLVLNGLWSFLFFHLRSPTLAAVEIVVLWGAIAWTGIVFHRRSPVAGWLLAPYLAWVTFAAALNFAIVRLNG